jgi:hypothetical protein
VRVRPFQVRGTLMTGLLCGAAFLAVGAARPALAQDQTEVLMPEQSAAKAKQLIQQAVSALGGSAYLGVKDVTCTGRVGQFGHNGDLNGFGKFVDYSKLPDKDRNENLPKRNIVEVYNGDKGWVLDRGGVSEAAGDSLQKFHEDMKDDIDNFLRNRWKEPDTILRYLGPDVVDLHEADWIEFVDADNRSIRVAFERSTHLPIRKIVVTRDPGTRLRSEETEYYSNYHPLDGVTTPFQIARDKNGHKVYQVFFDECHYNTTLDDAMFTKASLDERWAKVGKKTIKKKEKQEAAEKKEEENPKSGTSSN